MWIATGPQKKLESALRVLLECTFTDLRSWKETIGVEEESCWLVGWVGRRAVVGKTDFY